MTAVNATARLKSRKSLALAGAVSAFYVHDGVPEQVRFEISYGWKFMNFTQWSLASPTALAGGTCRPGSCHL